MSDQPDLLIQFIGALIECDPTEGTVTFRMREIPVEHLQAFARMTDKHIRAETQMLVLVYDLNDFTEYHKQVAVQLKAHQPAAADGFKTS